VLRSTPAEKRSIHFFMHIFFGDAISVKKPEWQERLHENLPTLKWKVSTGVM
jgi:hypothetical protein